MAHTTVEQNKAHRRDIEWLNVEPTPAANGHHYVREYRNPWTGFTIRKDWRMTGHDWHLFGPDGQQLDYPNDRAHSLTEAKRVARKQAQP